VVDGCPNELQVFNRADTDCVILAISDAHDAPTATSMEVWLHVDQAEILLRRILQIKGRELGPITFVHK